MSIAATDQSHGAPIGARCLLFQCYKHFAPTEQDPIFALTAMHVVACATGPTCCGFNAIANTSSS